MSNDDPEVVRDVALLIFATSFSKTEARVGLPRGTLLRIAELEDDWSFLVQLHALVETAITQLILEAFVSDFLRDRPKLISTLAKLPPRTKLDLAIGLGLAKERAKTARFLLDSRNGVAHSIAQAFRFSVDDLVRRAPPGVIPDYLHAAAGVGAAAAAHVRRTQPRAALLLAASGVLNDLDEIHRYQRYAREVEKERGTAPTLEAFREAGRAALARALEGGPADAG